MVGDISSWDNARNWKAWAIPRLPDQLEKQKNLLQYALTNLASVHMQLKDRWGWGNKGVYMATQGYVALQT